MKKQPQITAQTKENLTTAFWALYKIKKIEQITIKEITSLAGYNRSTFYLYYTDIYELLDSLEASLIESIQENIVKKSITLDADDSIIHKIVEIYKEKGEYLGVLLSEDGDPYFINKFKSVLKSIFFSQFSPSPETKQDIEIILEFSISAIIGAFVYWYQHEEEIDTNKFVILLRSLLSNGTLSKLQKQIK